MRFYIYMVYRVSALVQRCIEGLAPPYLLELCCLKHCMNQCKKIKAKIFKVQPFQIVMQDKTCTKTVLCKNCVKFDLCPPCLYIIQTQDIEFHTCKMCVGLQVK